MAGCIPQPNTEIDCSAEDDTACTYAQCEPISGECVDTILTPGTECDDDNPCTEETACDAAGDCLGKPAACDDGNQCTDNFCDPVSGCAPQLLQDGAECDDGNECTTDEACEAGECVPQSDGCLCQTSKDCPQSDDLCVGGYKCLGGTCVKEDDVTCPLHPNPCRINECQSGTGECITVNASGDTTCTDDDLCTLDDHCFNGICIGNTNQCDDGNACTNDSCSVGICQNEPAEDELCDDGDVCTKLEKCSNGVCGGGVFVCKCLADSQCDKFDDGDKCNGIWKCDNKTCVEDPASEIICLDGDAEDCSETFCVGALGICLTKGLADDEPCSDHDACTTGDVCFQGACIAANPPDCPDDDASDCVVPKCHPVLGTCLDASAVDETPCDDGNACTEEESCSNGLCHGALVACGDDGPCKIYACSQELGCKETLLHGECEDGYPCTEDTVCEEGECAGGESSCPCASNADCADLQTDLCAQSWFCLAGECQKLEDSEVICDEATENPCTSNQCNGETGECEETPLSDHIVCDDGDLCTQGDRCVAGACLFKTTTCSDGNSCTVDNCDAGACSFEPVQNGTVCDDGIACNGESLCQAAVCQLGEGNGCPCEKPSDCEQYEDGNPCNGTLICGAQGNCVIDQSTVIYCASDTAGCADAACTPETGECENVPRNNGTACDDGDVCSVGDSCDSGLCVAVAIGCEDGDPCTVDSCHPVFGCVHAATTGECDDGEPCTVNTHCVDGECTGEPNLCDDGQFCTNDTCQPGSGCVWLNKPPAVGCNDGNDCTTNDKCGDGVCAGGINLCTCNSDEDCEAEYDGNKCLGPLTCDEGACVRDQAAIVLCGTGSDCAYAVCDEATGECGKVPKAEGDSCDDDDACTSDSLCEVGECVGTPVVCEEGEVCQDVVCTAAGGCQVAHVDAACDDGTSCTIDDACVAGVCKGVPDGVNTYDFDSGDVPGWEADHHRR